MNGAFTSLAALLITTYLIPSALASKTDTETTVANILEMQRLDSWGRMQSERGGMLFLPMIDLVTSSSSVRALEGQ